MNRVFLALGFLLALATRADAQGLEHVKAHYTKYEYRIPMRDGIPLFTSVYVPKDSEQRYPMLLKRTPYSVRPYGVDQYPSDLGPSPLFGKAGYIFVYQDVRGRWMSGGEFVNMRPHRTVKEKPSDVDESTDTFDTIDWLLKHVPNHNGKVGQWGISYPGFYTAAGMIDAHSALKAVSPQAPIVDWFVGDDFHHNGALFLPHLFNFIADFGKPRPAPTKKEPRTFEHGTPDGYDFFLRMGPLSNADANYFKGNISFWNDVMRHGTYDEFWKSRNLRPHLKGIRPAVMTVGGWFDAENLFGALETYRSVEATSKTANVLVMGPWSHGGWGGGRDDGNKLGDVSFNSKTAVYYREQIELRFFEFHLKGKGEFKHPEAWVFETGRNVWHKHDAWPPKDAKARSLYFHANNGLAFDKKPTDSPVDHEEFVSDPAKPVPFQDKIAIGMSAEYMVADQRFAARRPDVLVFETEALEQDVTLAGPVTVELFVATTGTDADWVVKLIDVYPDDHPDPSPNPAGVHLGGYQQLVRGDVMRGKFRTSFEKPTPFTPGEPTVVKFTMPDIYHTFRPGHRLMVQVQSSWFPLVDRNPQTFTDIYTAKASAFQKATHRVYRSAEKASRLTVQVRP